jgi:UDP-glucose 4-epimerase
MAETIVITGGAGFIGSHIARRLLKDGVHVRIFDDFSTGKRANMDDIADHVELIEASVTNREALDKACAGATYVYHQAALASVPRSVANPQATHDANVNGTFNVLLAARDAGVKRVIYAASSSAYGDIEGDFKVETLPPAPTSPYGVSKLVGEYYCQVFTRVYGLETVALRYFNVFGPRQDVTSQYAAVIPRFIEALLRGQAPVIYGDGGQSRDFTYIDNVVHGNLLALTAPQAAGHMMNLAMGGRTTLLDLAQKLNALLGTNIAPQHDEARTGDIRHSCANIDLAGELLGYEPIVSFDEGLARTLAWYRDQITV